MRNKAPNEAERASVPHRALAVFHLAETSGPSRSLEAELAGSPKTAPWMSSLRARAPYLSSSGVRNRPHADYEALTLPRDPIAAARAASRLGRATPGVSLT